MASSDRPREPAGAGGGRLRAWPELSGGCLVVHVAGEIDHQTAALLRSRVLAAVPPAGALVVLDLAGVTFCDSSGIAVLVGLRKAAGRMGGELLLAGAGERCLHVIARYGLDRYLESRGTVQQAVTELAGRAAPAGQ